MNTYSDPANQTFITRDHAEEELEESPPWWVLLVLVVGFLIAFQAVVFEHDFLF